MKIDSSDKSNMRKISATEVAKANIQNIWRTHILKTIRKRKLSPRGNRGFRREHTLAIQKRKYTNEMMLLSINRKSCLLSLVIMGGAY